MLKSRDISEKICNVYSNDIDESRGGCYGVEKTNGIG